MGCKFHVKNSGSSSEKNSFLFSPAVDKARQSLAPGVIGRQMARLRPGGLRSEPYRHYAIPGGVNSHKPHGVSGLVVGNKKPPVVRPGACTYRGKYRAIELQLADPTPPVGQQLPPGQRSQPRRHCSTGSAHAGARRRSRRWRTRPTPAWG